jgi:hypothetical protein
MQSSWNIVESGVKHHNGIVENGAKHHKINIPKNINDTYHIFTSSITLMYHVSRHW